MAHEYEMSLKEFKDFGFLQEANRQFFHPLGLALTVLWDEDDPDNENGVDMETAGPGRLSIQDWRHLDDEGGAFESLDDKESQEKAERVEELRAKTAEVREERFGWVIQPIGHSFYYD